MLLAWLLVALCFVGVALHPLTNADIAWYLIGTRTWDAGAVLSVDVRDPNTPFVWYQFLLAEHLAQWLGLPTHRVFYVLVAAVNLAAIGFAANLLPPRPNGIDWRRWATVLAASYGFGFASLGQSGQRDLLAAVLVLPYLAWLQCLSEGVAAHRWRGWVATLLLGVAILTKPHFVVWPLLAEVLLAWRRRSLHSPLRWDLLGPALICAAIGGALLALHPQYLEYLRVYGAFYADWPAADLSLRVWLDLGLLLVALTAHALLPGERHGWSWMLLAGAVAAALTAAVQAKWWDYQVMAVEPYALAALAVLTVQANWRASRRRFATAAILLLALGWTGNSLWQAARQQKLYVLDGVRLDEARGLAKVIDRLAPGQPVAILGGWQSSAAAYFSTATWALTDPPQWVVIPLEEMRRRGIMPSEEALMAERRNFAEVATRLAEARPSLVIFHRGDGQELPDFERYFLGDPQISAVMAGWRQVETYGGYSLWQRQP